MSKWGKSKLARQKADRLFPELEKPPMQKREVAAVAGSVDDVEDPAVRPTHQSNPFGNDFEEMIDDDEDVLKRIFTIPRAIELPAGYPSTEHLREAMRRAWSIEWGNFEANTVDILLPSDWGVETSKEGRVLLFGNYGVRATWDRSPDAKVRLLSRYHIDNKFHPKDGFCQLVVRDRQMDSKIEHESYWYPQSGENHPQWSEMQAWLDEYCPDHRDPLLHWDDCEDNNERWEES